VRKECTRDDSQGMHLKIKIKIKIKDLFRRLRKEHTREDSQHAPSKTKQINKNRKMVAADMVT
jgi:hypothetical protein